MMGLKALIITFYDLNQIGFGHIQLSLNYSFHIQGG